MSEDPRTAAIATQLYVDAMRGAPHGQADLRSFSSPTRDTDMTGREISDERRSSDPRRTLLCLCCELFEFSKAASPTGRWSLQSGDLGSIPVPLARATAGMLRGEMRTRRAIEVVKRETSALLPGATPTDVQSGQLRNERSAAHDRRSSGFEWAKARPSTMTRLGLAKSMTVT